VNDFFEYYIQLDGWLRANLLMICMAQIATLLVLFGDQINAIVRALVKPYPFLIRVSAFIALCTAGYGAITAYSVSIYVSLLAKVNSDYLFFVIAITFIIIGVVAEKGWKRGTRIFR